MKERTPKALREQVWLKHVGRKYQAKCKTVWCANVMSVFDFQSGHDIPESKGGSTTIENLYPICSRCNLSMSNTYTFKEWNQLSKPIPIWRRLLLWVTRERYVTKVDGIPLPLKITNPKGKHTTSRGKS